MSGSDRRTFLFQTAGALAGVSLLPETLAAKPVRLQAPVRVGLIGAGRHGRAILTELQKLPDVTIAGVADPMAERRRIAGERAPGAELFSDHQALIDRSDIPALIVATPTHLHRAVAEAVIAAGRHLYLEAPLAHTVEDAEGIGRAAADAPGVMAAGFQLRANPLYPRAWSFMGSDNMRDPVSLTAQWHRKTSWRFPAPEPGTGRQVNWRLDPEVSLGLPGEVGVHQFDVARWFLGRPPVQVRGGGGIRLYRDDREVFDTVQAEFGWDDGVTLAWRATLANSFGGAWETIHGVNGAIRLTEENAWLFKEVDAPTLGWEVYATRQQFFRDEGIVLRADATKLAAQGDLQRGGGLPHPSLYYSLVAFLASVTEGAPVACPMAEGVASTVLAIRAQQAVQTGEPVTIPG